MGSVSFAIRRNSFFTFLKVGNTNGSAAVGVLYAILRGASNGIGVNKCSLSGRGGGVGRLVKVIFRNSMLSGRLAIGRGLRSETSCCKLGGGRVTGEVRDLARAFGLSRVLGEGCNALDNNRHEQISVTETLVGQPGLLFLSRPAAKLSPGAELRI